MTFFIFLTALAALVLSPYIIIISKRKRMLKRIIYIAKKNGYHVRPLHKTALLAPNTSAKYDYLFESRTQAYAVKLWSSTRKDSTLYVRSDGAVIQQAYVPSELSVDDGRTRQVKYGTKRLKRTQQNFKLKGDKPVVNILLIYPSHKSIVYTTPQGKTVLRSGDMLFDKQICLPLDFEKMLSQ